MAVRDLAGPGVRPAPREARALPVSWRTLAGLALVVWLASRFGYLLATYYDLVFFQRPTGHLLESLTTPWLQWDGDWYYLLSRYGYAVRQDSNFFPLYPAIVGGVMTLIGHAHDGSGYLIRLRVPLIVINHTRLGVMLLVANAAALAAFWGTALLAWHESHSRSRVVLALLVMSAYPLAFFLAGPFAESLFVAAMAFALYFGRRGLWWPAAGAAFLAGLDRPIAVIIVLPLGYEFLRQHIAWEAGWDPRRWRWRDHFRIRWLAEFAAVVAAMPLGLGVYMAYLWRQFGNPLEFSYTQNHYWHHRFTPFWWAVIDQLRIYARHWTWHNPIEVMSLVDWGAIVAVLVVTLLMLRRQPVAFTLYSLGLIAITTADPRFDIWNLMVGVSRYMTAAIPVFLAVGAWLETRPAAARGVLAVGFMTQAVLLCGYLAGIIRVTIF